MTIRSGSGRRWILDRVGYGLAGLVAVLFILELVTTARSDWARDWAFANGDLIGYLTGAQRFLDTGSGEFNR